MRDNPPFQCRIHICTNGGFDDLYLNHSAQQKPMYGNDFFLLRVKKERGHIVNNG